MTWPGSFYVDYDYLVTGEMEKARENGATSGVGVLATYAYDNLGRRATLTRGNGNVTTYGFDGISRLTSLENDADGTEEDQSWTFSHNPGAQITTKTRANSAFDWTMGTDSSAVYTANGLNQYLTVAGASATHDARGNMTADGLGKTFAYDADNRLISSSGGTSSTLSYDPTGRLYQVAASATTRFLYDGMQAIAEYDGSGNLQRRYVPGAGVDETIAWYEGTDTSDRRFLMTDERGSVVAIANSSGVVTNINKYDEYGAPASGNIGRFQYTGQMWIAEAGLYHYKARSYHPTIGRFMQTDPIGYGDGMNLYAYVGNSPISNVDPMGLEIVGLEEALSQIANDVANALAGNLGQGFTLDWKCVDCGARETGDAGSRRSRGRTWDGLRPGSGCQGAFGNCLSIGGYVGGNNQFATFALSALFVVALITPIPGDEVLAGALLLRGGAALGRAAARRGAARGVLSPRVRIDPGELREINKFMAPAIAASTIAGVSGGYAGYVKRGPTAVFRCAFTGATLGGAAIILPTALGAAGTGAVAGGLFIAGSLGVEAMSNWIYDIGQECVPGV